MEKHDEYAAKILASLGELFNEESENFIDQDELKEGDNMTHFAHALANVAPCFFVNKITGIDNNLLEHNHLANQLVFQYAKAK